MHVSQFFPLAPGLHLHCPSSSQSWPIEPSAHLHGLQPAQLLKPKCPGAHWSHSLPTTFGWHLQSPLRWSQNSLPHWSHSQLVQFFFSMESPWNQGAQRSHWLPEALLRHLRQTPLRASQLATSVTSMLLLHSHLWHERPAKPGWPKWPAEHTSHRVPL